jgi:hypothetical protein
VAAKLFIETMHNNEDMSKVEEVLKPKLFIRESSQRMVQKLHARRSGDTVPPPRH